MSRNTSTRSNAASTTVYLSQQSRPSESLSTHSEDDDWCSSDGDSSQNNNGFFRIVKKKLFRGDGSSKAESVNQGHHVPSGRHTTPDRPQNSHNRRSQAETSSPTNSHRRRRLRTEAVAVLEPLSPVYQPGSQFSCLQTGYSLPVRSPRHLEENSQLSWETRETGYFYPPPSRPPELSPQLSESVVASIRRCGDSSFSSSETDKNSVVEPRLQTGDREVDSQLSWETRETGYFYPPSYQAPPKARRVLPDSVVGTNRRQRSPSPKKDKSKQETDGYWDLRPRTNGPVEAQKLEPSRDEGTSYIERRKETKKEIGEGVYFDSEAAWNDYRMSRYDSENMPSNVQEYPRQQSSRNSVKMVPRTTSWDYNSTPPESFEHAETPQSGSLTRRLPQHTPIMDGIDPSQEQSGLLHSVPLQRYPSDFPSLS